MSAATSITEVKQRWASLVLGWVTALIFFSSRVQIPPAPTLNFENFFLKTGAVYGSFLPLVAIGCPWGAVSMRKKRWNRTLKIFAPRMQVHHGQNWVYYGKTGIWRCFGNPRYPPELAGPLWRRQLMWRFLNENGLDFELSAFKVSRGWKITSPRFLNGLTAPAPLSNSIIVLQTHAKPM